MTDPIQKIEKFDILIKTLILTIFAINNYYYVR